MLFEPGPFLQYKSSSLLEFLLVFEVKRATTSLNLRALAFPRYFAGPYRLSRAGPVDGQPADRLSESQSKILT